MLIFTQKLAGTSERIDHHQESNTSSPVNVTNEEEMKESASNKLVDGKESTATPASKAKRKSRFETEVEQSNSKRKDEKCDMFAETDTFGTNVNVCVLYPVDFLASYKL